MHLVTEDLLHMAASLAWLEAVASDFGWQLADPLGNQNDLDYMITLIWGLLVCLIVDLQHVVSG